MQLKKSIFLLFAKFTGPNMQLLSTSPAPHRQDLMERLETSLEDYLNKVYMAKDCSATLDCMWHMVAANSLYLKLKDVLTNLKEDSYSD